MGLVGFVMGLLVVYFVFFWVCHESLVWFVMRPLL